MRWVFQCFEGIELLHIRIGSSFQTRILRLQPLHQQTFACLALPTNNSIFYLLKLQKVGSSLWVKSHARLVWEKGLQEPGKAAPAPD
jgi:hypothetical protein